MKNNFKRVNRILLLIACTFFALSCSNKQPKTIKSDKFVDLMSEVMVIENLTVSDSLKAAMIQNVFNEKKITLTEFENTIKTAENDPGFWYNVYTQIKDQMKENPKPGLSE